MAPMPDESMPKPRVWNFMPYSWDDVGWPRRKHLAETYNAYMALIPDHDWACFLDHDVFITTKCWFHLIEEAIQKEPNAGAFIAMTNRLNPRKSGWQMTDRHDYHNTCAAHHRKIGYERHVKFGCSLRDVTDIEGMREGYKPFAGFCFIISKRVWQTIKGAPKGTREIDWAIHRKIRKHGLRIYVIEGLYIFHWYREEEQYPTKATYIL